MPAASHALAAAASRALPGPLAACDTYSDSVYPNEYTLVLAHIQKMTKFIIRPLVKNAKCETAIILTLN